MLKTKGLKKSFGKLEVLKGIDISIDKRTIVSIVGASGAGKSTLLYLLGLLDKPTAGNIYLNDKELTQLKSKEISNLRNREMGFIFQFHNLFPEFTALENVAIPAFIAKDGEALKKAKRLLNLLGLSERMHHKPSELSGGEQQRVSVARALINEPAIVFADEPSGNLDSNTAEELHQLFFSLRESLSQTFVLVTHNEKLANLADKKLELCNGSLYER